MKLHLFPIILFAVFHTLSAEPLSGENVKKTRNTDYGYVVGLAKIDPTKRREDNLYCSGVLVTLKHVLTNERCIKGKHPHDVVVYIGLSDVYLTADARPCFFISYTNWQLRPSNEEALDLGIHDVAIITLCAQIAVYQLHPPRVSKETFETHKAFNALMIGFGNTLNLAFAKYRTKASVYLIEPSVCAKITKLRSVETGRLICSASQPYAIATKGDGGAPLLDRARNLMGIHSSMFYGRQGDPHTAVNVHVNVSHYKDFIRTIAGDDLPRSWF